MTTTLSFPRVLRHPTWYALILLPILPGLMGLLGGRGAEDPAGATRMLILLLTVGVALALALPPWVERLGNPVRKEVDQLRPAWLASVFVVQVPLFPWLYGGGIEGVVFGGTCALLAAIPFGAEFQQRTLSALLSQPVRRDDWWFVKTRVLAVALGLHALLFLLSAAAAGCGVAFDRVMTVLVLAALAYATTPWWTLVTRGLLAGLVFSIAVPLIGVAVIANLAVAMARWASWSAEGFEGAMTTGVYGVGLVALAVYAWQAGTRAYQRWAHLEAPDSPSSEAGLVGLPRWRAATAERSAAKGVWRTLLAKELHLQALALWVGAAAVGCAVLAWLIDLNADARGVAMAGVAVAAVTAIILAGATPMAEERRLGTLDVQLLVPVSRWGQWWVKVGVAGGVALMMMAVLWVTFHSPTSVPGEPSAEAVAVALVGVALFAPALLASSASQHALRAILAAMGVIALIALMIGLAMVSAGELNSRISDSTYRAGQADFEALMAAAAALTPEQAAALGRPPFAWMEGPVLAWIRWLPLLPGVLALSFAARNFTHPVEARRRIVGQFATCLGLLLVLIMGFTLALAWMTREMAVAGNLRAARVILEVEPQLSPADRLLWEEYRQAPFVTFAQVGVTNTVERDEGIEVTGFGPRGFQLPLNAASRRLLIHRGRIPAELREALVNEAKAKGEDMSPPPADLRRLPPLPNPYATAPGAPRFGISSGLRARYGLAPMIRSGVVGSGGNEPQTNAPTPGPPGPAPE